MPVTYTDIFISHPQYRRHLNREQRRALIAESLKADPQLSNREHARRTGTSDKTAGDVRSGLEAGANNYAAEPSPVVGVDGKTYPSSQPRREPVEQQPQSRTPHGRLKPHI